MPCSCYHWAVQLSQACSVTTHPNPSTHIYLAWRREFLKSCQIKLDACIYRPWLGTSSTIIFAFLYSASQIDFHISSARSHYNIDTSQTYSSICCAPILQSTYREFWSLPGWKPVPGWDALPEIDISPSSLYLCDTWCLSQCLWGTRE